MCACVCEMNNNFHARVVYWEDVQLLLAPMYCHSVTYNLLWQILLLSNEPPDSIRYAHLGL